MLSAHRSFIGPAPFSTPSNEFNCWTRRDWVACMVCVLVAVLLATAPHLTTLVHYGSPEFLADNDDVFYLALLRAPYWDGWAMRDGFLPADEKVIDLHSWTQFVPFAKLGRVLGIPVLLMGALWRVFGGCLLAISLFLLFRSLFAHMSNATGWALVCTLICVCDAGFCDGRSLVENFVKLIPHLWRGSTPLSKPDAIPQFRIVAPLANLPFLIGMVAALIPVGRRHIATAIVGGICLGICVLLYFYFWTAAVLALAGYGATLLLVAHHRPGLRGPILLQVRRIVIVLAVGMGIGAPQIYSNLQSSKNPQIQPYLERSGRPTHLAVGDSSRKRNLMNVWVWGKLAIGAVGVFVLSQLSLGLLWWLVLGGYILSNLAIITGLEFENFHWVLVHAPMGEILLLAVIVGVLDQWSSVHTRRSQRWVWAVAACLLVIAFVWRPYEVLRAPLSVRMNQAVQQIRPLHGVLASLGTDRTLAGPFESQVAILHSRSAVLFDDPYTPVLLISMEEVNQRHALNGWLQGLDYDAYKSSPSLTVTTEFAYVRPEWSPESVARDRLAIFQRLLQQPAQGALLTNRFEVTDLMLPAGTAAPSRAGPWSLIGKSDSWSLWTRANTDSNTRSKERPAHQ